MQPSYESISFTNCNTNLSSLHCNCFTNLHTGCLSVFFHFEKGKKQFPQVPYVEKGTKHCSQSRHLHLPCVICTFWANLSCVFCKTVCLNIQKRLDELMQKGLNTKMLYKTCGKYFNVILKKMNKCKWVPLRQ